MDSVLPALVAVGILLLASLTVGRSSFTSFNTLGDAWVDAEGRSIERVRSDIAIDSITVNGADIDVVVRNDGETRLVDFSAMDVVVQYTGGGDLHIKYLPFTTESSPQPDDSWRVLSVGNDVIDPGVVNMGETLTVRLRLNPAPDTGSHWLQVTTELGISASSFFTN